MMLSNSFSSVVKDGETHRAQKIFENAKNKTTMMYNTMINGKSSPSVHTLMDSFRLGLAEHNQGQEGIDLFRRMSVPSNEYTFAIMFKICAQLADDASLEFGQKMLDSLPHEYRRKTVVLNGALHMLMQRRNAAAGEQLFNRMDKDNVTYGTMMSGEIKAHRILSTTFHLQAFWRKINHRRPLISSITSRGGDVVFGFPGKPNFTHRVRAGSCIRRCREL
jgi:hypothetical protein